MSKPKRIRILGFVFMIRKLDMFDYLNGSQVMVAQYGTYEDVRKSSAEAKNPNFEKMRQHYKDVLMAGIVEPKIVRKQEDDKDAILVDNLFSEPELVNALYEEIIAHSYGKKKFKRIKSRARRY